MIKRYVLILVLLLSLLIFSLNVSAVQIASDTNGGPTLSDTDYFGSSATSIGDLNGDTVEDMVVGAYMDDTGGPNRGAVYVLFMNTDGTVASSVKIASDTNGGPTLADADYFGHSVASIGDLNGDTVEDLVVGASMDDTGSYNGGAAYILFMNTDGTVASSVKIASDTNGGPTLNIGDYFGSSVAFIGDLDNDGVGDIAVGAPRDSTGGPSRGAAYVLFMNTDGTVASSVQIASSTNGGPTLSDYDGFGTSITSIGDLNGDTVEDIVVGAQFDDTGDSNRGAVYVLFMNTDGTVASSVQIASSTNGGPILAINDFFGSSVVSISDLNSDGVADLVVGAYGGVTDGTKGGAAYVLFMNTDGTVASSVQIASSTNGGPTLAAVDRFGSSVASIGDLDNDGVDDLAIGAYMDDTGGDNRGAVYVLFMSTGVTTTSSTKVASGLNGGPILTDGDYFGSSATSIGDLDNDGVDDLAIGAHFDDTGGTNRGAAHIFFMNTDGTVASSVKIASDTNGGPTLADSDLFGRSVASIGDLNGDTIEDIVVGAPWDDAGGNGADRGAAYVLFMNTDGTVASSVKIASGLNGGPTLASGDHFGSSISSIGDLDNDGVEDLVVGAYEDDTGGSSGSDRGAAYVLFMNTDGTVASSVKIASGLNGGPTLTDRDNFGSSVASIGDLNGDTIEDLVVGAPLGDTGGSDRGAAYVLFMNTDGTVASSVQIASGTNGGPTLANGDYFGSSISQIGDIDNDGTEDLAVGAIGDDTGGADRGAAYVLFMNTDGTVASSTKLTSNPNGEPAISNYDNFGSSVAGIGDLNGDSVEDMVVGAYRDDTGGDSAGVSSNRGAFYVLFMTGSGTSSAGPRTADDSWEEPSVVMIVDLTQGFNVVSVPVNDLSFSMASDLSVDAVYDWTGTDWNIYVAGTDVGDFTLQEGKSYFVYSENGGQLTFTGTPYAFTPIINTGFNLISIPQDITLNDILAATDCSWAYAWTGSNYIISNNIINTNHVVEAGSGVWVYC